MSLRAYRFAVDHRGVLLLAIAAATLLLVALGVVSSAAPAAAVGALPATSGTPLPVLLARGPSATNGTTPSPADWGAYVTSISSVSDATNYLSFVRWRGVNQTPSPDTGFANIAAAVGAGMLGFGRLAFIVSSFAIYVVGFVLTQAVQLDLLERASYTVDGIFGAVGRSLLDGQTSTAGVIGTISALGLLVLSLFALVAWQYFKTGLGPGVGARNGRLPVFAKTLVIGLSALTIFTVMVVQSEKNHGGTGAGKSPAAAYDSTTVLNKTTDSSDFSDPATWAPMSPGWIMAEVGVLMNFVGGVVQVALGSLSSAVDAAGDTSTNEGECGLYVDALDAAFLSTDAADNLAGNANLLLSYGKLAETVYFEPYVLATMGDSDGAKSAWCRLAEVQANRPAGEQVWVSQQAGLYREAVGTPGGEGSLVTSSGAWKGSNGEGAADATSLFGPNYPNPSSLDKATAFWAACNWGTRNSGVSFNSEWGGVQNADQEPDGILGKIPFISSFDLLQDKEDISVDDCTDVLRGENNGGGYEDDKKVGIGFDSLDADGDDDSGRNPRWYYHEESGTTGLALFGIGDSSSTPYFAPAAIRNGDSSAFDYYLTTHGLNASSTLIYALLTAAISLFTVKYMVPLVIGGVIAQLSGVVALLFAPMIVALLTIPVRRTITIAKTLGKTVVFAYGAVVLYVSVIMLSITVVSMFRALFYDEYATGFLRIAQLGIATVLGFVVTGIVLRKLFALDFTSFRRSVMTSASIANAPILDHVGGRDFERPRVFRERDRDGESTSNSSVGSSVGRRFRKTRDDARGGIDELLRNPAAREAAGAAAGYAAGRARDRWFGGNNEQDESMANTGTASTEVAAITGTTGAAAADSARTPLCTCGHTQANHYAARNGRRKCRDCDCGGYTPAPGSGDTSSFGAGAASADGFGGVPGPRNPTTVPGAAPTEVPSHVAARERAASAETLAGVVAEMRPEYARADPRSHPAIGLREDEWVDVSSLPARDYEALRATSSGFESRDPEATGLDAAGITAFLDGHGVEGAAAVGVRPFDGVDDVTRIATIADGVPGRPLSRDELSAMTPSDRAAYLGRRLDAVRDDTASEGWYANRSAIAGSVMDPQTGLWVPESIVRAGTPDALPETNGAGVAFLGMAPREDGTWSTTAVPDARVVSPFLLDSDTPPLGVTAEEWDDWRDMRSWMELEGVDPLEFDVSEWPEERREQFDRATESVGAAYEGLGHPLPATTDDALAATVLGLSETRNADVVRNDFHLARLDADLDDGGLELGGSGPSGSGPDGDRLSGPDAPVLASVGASSREEDDELLALVSGLSTPASVRESESDTLPGGWPAVEEGVEPPTGGVEEGRDYLVATEVLPTFEAWRESSPYAVSDEPDAELLSAISDVESVLGSGTPRWFTRYGGAAGVVEALGAGELTLDALAESSERTSAAIETRSGNVGARTAFDRVARRSRELTDRPDRGTSGAEARLAYDRWSAAEAKSVRERSASYGDEVLDRFRELDSAFESGLVLTPDDVRPGKVVRDALTGRTEPEEVLSFASGARAASAEAGDTAGTRSWAELEELLVASRAVRRGTSPASSVEAPPPAVPTRRPARPYEPLPPDQAAYFSDESGPALP